MYRVGLVFSWHILYLFVESIVYILLWRTADILNLLNYSSDWISEINLFRNCLCIIGVTL